jgi:hypothetical protein
LFGPSGACEPFRPSTPPEVEEGEVVEEDPFADCNISENVLRMSHLSSDAVGKTYGDNFKDVPRDRDRLPTWGRAGERRNVSSIRREVPPFA